MPSGNVPSLRLLHLNDVYRLEPSEHDPVGGVTRFQSLCNHYRQDPKYQDQPQLITLFSGDGFGPSLRSSVTKGAHMVPILNNVPVAAACVGDHELDMGVPQFEYLASQRTFPWLPANVTDPALGDDVPLGHAHKTTILTSSHPNAQSFLRQGEGPARVQNCSIDTSISPEEARAGAHFPFEDPVVVIRVKGQQLLEALQNGVSKYPALDGRLPQVSNISFTFDPSRDSHDRIVAVQVNGKPLDLERESTLATREYMVKGGDGYTCLRTQLQGGSTISIVDEENGILVSMLLRQHFLSSMTVGRWKHWGAALGHHWGTIQEQLRRTGSVVERTDTSHTFRRDSNDASARRTSVDVSSGRRKSSAVWDRPPVRIVEPAEMGLSESEDESEVTAPVLARELSPEEHELVVARKAMRKWWRLAGLSKRHAMGYETGEELGVGWTRGICPQVEGRIKMVLRVL